MSEMTPQQRNELADAIGHLRVSSQQALEAAEELDAMAVQFGRAEARSAEDDELRWQCATGAAAFAGMLREMAEERPRWLNAVADLYDIPRPPGPSTPPEPDELLRLEDHLVDEPDASDEPGAASTREPSPWWRHY